MHGYATRGTWLQHSVGKERDLFFNSVDVQLRRYSHFSDHKIIKVDSNILYAQMGDKPIQAFTFEKLVLTGRNVPEPTGYFSL